jgi:hypothetical protein
MGLPGVYTVQYDAAFPTGPWVSLTNVQAVTFRAGRRAQLDPYYASSAEILVRYTTGYATPLTAMVPGTAIQILSPNQTAYPYGVFYGRIQNVAVRYGIPYSGGVGPADFLEIKVEGAFAEAARMSGADYAMAAGTLATQISTMNAQTGLTAAVWGTTYGVTPNMAATTISGTWGDWLNSSLVTINGRMADFGGIGGINLRPYYTLATCTVNFSDTANNATNQVYDQISFDAIADNYYTQVKVDSESYPVQTATKAGATTPYRTLTVNTLNSSTSQAADLAQFLLSQYQTPEFAISQISCSAESQNVFKLDNMGLSGLQECIGARVNVAFRGTTYSCLIEGVSVTAYPESARYTFDVSGADLNNYLVLNNSVFGKLNENKLGY